MSARVVRFAFEPTRVLLALLSLRASARAVAPALAEAVRREFERVGDELARLGGSIEWLEDRGIAVVDRPRTRARRRAGARAGSGDTLGTQPSYALRTAVHVDLRALERAVHDEGARREGPAHASMAALRTVCDALRAGAFVTTVGSPRVGRVSVRLSSLRALFAPARGSRAGAKRESPGSTAKRSPIDNSVAPATSARARRARADEPQRVAPSEPARTAARSAPVEPTARAAPSPRAQHASTREASRPGARVDEGHGRKTGAAGSVPPPGAARVRGFGGLADDAESLAPDAAPMGPRGISLDAEHFLAAAGIASWPCSAPTLDQGRRRALAKLHPDHAGEGSAQAFHRAIRGHRELTRWLEQHASERTNPDADAPPSQGSTKGAASRSASIRPESSQSSAETRSAATCLGNEPAGEALRTPRVDEGAAHKARRAKRAQHTSAPAAHDGGAGDGRAKVGPRATQPARRASVRQWPPAPTV